MAPVDQPLAVLAHGPDPRLVVVDLTLQGLDLLDEEVDLLQRSAELLVRDDSHLLLQPVVLVVCVAQELEDFLLVDQLFPLLVQGTHNRLELGGDSVRRLAELFGSLRLQLLQGLRLLLDLGDLQNTTGVITNTGFL